MYPPPPVPPPESPDMRSSRRRWESSPSPDHLAPAINFHELVNSYHRILEGARTDAPVDRMLQNASYGAQVLESANIPAVVSTRHPAAATATATARRGRIEAPRPIEPPQPPPQPERKRTPPPRRLEPAPPREKPVLSPVLAEAPSALSATSSVLILSNLKKGDEFIHTVPGSESTTPLKAASPSNASGAKRRRRPSGVADRWGSDGAAAVVVAAAAALHMLLGGAIGVIICMARARSFASQLRSADAPRPSAAAADHVLPLRQLGGVHTRTRGCGSTSTAAPAAEASSRSSFAQPLYQQIHHPL
ncbi:unnamed protein product, partial [Mycena citricolor]